MTHKEEGGIRHNVYSEFRCLYHCYSMYGEGENTLIRLEEEIEFGGRSGESAHHLGR